MLIAQKADTKMLYNRPPTTSLLEDLKELNLLAEDVSTSPPQVKQPDEKGGDYVGPPDDKKDREPGYVRPVGDKAAGSRHEVMVRDDKPSNKEPAKVSEKELQVSSVQPTGPALSESKHRPIPGFMKQKFAAKQVAEERKVQQEAEAARTAVVDAAMAVIEAFYQEPDAQLTESELRSVINAYSVVTDQYDTVLESVTSALENVLAEGEDEDAPAPPPCGKKPKGVMIALGMGAPKPAEDEDEAPAKKSKKPAEDEGADEDESEDKAEESLTPTIGRARRFLESTTPAANKDKLVSELKELDKPSPAEEAVNRHLAIIEGYEELRSRSDAICGKILKVVAESQGVSESDCQLDEADDRVRIGAYFESIIDSAEKYLTALAEGKVDDDTAASDLEKVVADFNKGLDAMKQVKA